MGRYRISCQQTTRGPRYRLRYRCFGLWRWVREAHRYEYSLVYSIWETHSKDSALAKQREMNADAAYERSRKLNAWQSVEED